jgi:hypothetical protein
LFKHLGNVDTDIKTAQGESIFIKDQCQLSEEDRLIRIFKDEEEDPSKFYEDDKGNNKKNLLDKRIGKKH